MRVLCTGGAGYVGSACVRYLLANGYEAFAFDNLSAGNRAAVPDHPKRLIVGDLSDLSALVMAIRETEADAVMHFAAVASVPESIKDPLGYWKNNVVGTFNLLQAMRLTGVDRLVFSSTAATYAFTDEMPLTEDSAQVPVTPYGSTKLACEHMIDECRRAYGLGYTTMRYFNASGADPDGDHGEDRAQESHLIPLVLYAAVGRRDRVYVFGNDWNTRDGSCVRDFVHVWDIAQAHERALATQQAGVGRTYNIGSGTGSTVLEVVRECERVHGAKLDVEYAPRRPGDPAVLVASAARLSKELDWKPLHSDLATIVETAHRWHTRHPNGYHDKLTRSGSD